VKVGLIYIATLWEIIVFSLSSKSWKTVGFRMVWAPRSIIRRLSKQHDLIYLAVNTYLRSKFCNPPEQLQGGLQKESIHA
jgi:hypothetical protein